LRRITLVFALISCISGCDGSNGGGGSDVGLDGVPDEVLAAGVAVVGGVLVVREFLNRRAEAAEQQRLNSDPPVARRTFAGPRQFRPSDFEVYGIVAFSAAPTTANFSRFMMICEAFMQGISPVSAEAPVTSSFALTVWPLVEEVSDEQIGSRLREACTEATNLYDANASREVIDDAIQLGQPMQGRGPFLIAWNSGDQLSTETRQVALLDMS